MAKFNLNQLLSGASLGAKQEETAEVKEVKPGKKKLEIAMLSVHDLVPSKDNFYSMEQIQDLKTAIELAGGVKQNLNVMPLGDGKYKVLAGHRRRLASLSLVEEGKPEFEFVPCGIEVAEEDPELQQIQEELLIILTNSQRVKTDWDKIEEAKRLKAVLERYKKSAKLPGRVREIVADFLKTSPAQIGRLEAIANNLVPEFQEELKAERVGVSAAYELSGLPEEQQKQAFEEYKKNGGVSIEDAKHKKRTAAKKVKQEDQPQQDPPLPGQMYFDGNTYGEEQPKEEPPQEAPKPTLAEQINSAIEHIGALSGKTPAEKEIYALTIEALEFYKRERG